MPARIDAYSVDRAVLYSDGQQGRHVLVDFLTITEFVDSLNLTRLVDGRLVFHANLGAELILSGEIESTRLIVDTDDRGKTDTVLVTQQVNTFCVFLQGSHLLTIASSSDSLEITSEIDISLGGLYLYITNFCLIGGITVDHTQTTIEGEVGDYLAGSTNLYTIVILASFHIAVHVVALST